MEEKTTERLPGRMRPGEKFLQRGISSILTATQVGTGQQDGIAFKGGPAPGTALAKEGGKKSSKRKRNTERTYRVLTGTTESGSEIWKGYYRSAGH